MNSLRRLLTLAAIAALGAGAAVVAQPDPSQARANPACEVAGGVTAPATGAVAGAIGLGNPAAGICEAVTSKVEGAVTKPITDALKGVGNSIFEQVTTWTAEGATWLIDKVVEGIEKTTTPDLTSKGFLGEYAKMAQIAVLLGTAMLLLAILEAVAQSSWQILVKAVLINVPIAFIGTSAAFAVVQLLLLASDQMSHAIAVATHHQSEHFFKSAITGLGEAGAAVGKKANSGSPVGETAGAADGGVVVPLFVTFLAAIIGAVAAFFVWIEMLMRDAAIYVVALFMPISMATFISPRWSGILRRTCELLVVVIGSKFVIVSIIALAAGLISEGGAPVEHILAASALLLLACFSPFVLMRLVLSTESAMSAAYSRRSASGGAVGGLQLSSEVAILRNMARSNWGGSGPEPPEVWSVKGGAGGGGAARGGGASGGGGANPGGGGGGAGGRSGGASGGAAAGGATGGAAAAGAASGGVGVMAAAPGAAVGSAKSATGHLEGAAAARGAEAGGGSSKPDGGGAGAGPGGEGTERPSGSQATPPAPERSARPPRDLDVKPAGGGGSS